MKLKVYFNIRNYSLNSNIKEGVEFQTQGGFCQRERLTDVHTWWWGTSRAHVSAASVSQEGFLILSSAEQRCQKAQPSRRTFARAFLSTHTFSIFIQRLALIALTYKICSVMIPLDDWGHKQHTCLETPPPRMYRNCVSSFTGKVRKMLVLPVMPPPGWESSLKDRFKVAWLCPEDQVTSGPLPRHIR